MTNLVYILSLWISPNHTISVCLSSFFSDSNPFPSNILQRIVKNTNRSHTSWIKLLGIKTFKTRATLSDTSMQSTLRKSENITNQTPFTQSWKHFAQPFSALFLCSPASIKPDFTFSVFYYHLSYPSNLQLHRWDPGKIQRISDISSLEKQQYMAQAEKGTRIHAVERLRFTINIHQHIICYTTKTIFNINLQITQGEVIEL